MGYGILEAADTGEGFDPKRGLAAAAQIKQFLIDSGDTEGAENLDRLMRAGPDAMFGAMNTLVSERKPLGRFRE
jgi:hypothetical protein